MFPEFSTPEVHIKSLLELNKNREILVFEILVNHLNTSLFRILKLEWLTWCKMKN